MSQSKAEVNEGWERRLTGFNTRDFGCTLRLKESCNPITDQEYKRLAPKLIMVQEIAKKMALNMLKGTLKYQTDDWPLHVWEEMGDDDLVDVLMYRALERAARAK